jgi:hypothetical protein
MEELLKYAQSIQQSRSRFQIERFVIGQHDTAEMQFYQLCLELQTLITSSKRLEIEIEKTKLQVKRLLMSGDEMDALDAELAKLGLASQEASLESIKKEMAILVDIWNLFEKKFSREEIEANQEDYWVKRLTRQANSQAIGQGSVDMGHIEALQQVGALENFVRLSGNSDSSKEIL